MRLAFAFLALIGLAGTSLSAAPARDWAATVTKAADGGFVIGNPAARVKVIEFSSYTCPHCAAFSVESAKVLKGQMIRSGSTSLEVHNLIRDSLDLTAAIVARCAGPTKFEALHAAIFARQQEWLPRGADFQSANDSRLAMYSPLARLRAYADGSGLADIARANGVATPAIDACFATADTMNGVLALQKTVPAGITGTPMFLVNGTLAKDVYSWGELEPILRARGVK